MTQKKNNKWTMVNYHAKKQTSQPQCYHPQCNNQVATSKKSGKQLCACKIHLSTFYTHCIKCIKNKRVRDSKTQRSFLFCKTCYKQYVDEQRISTNRICDRCKINYRSPNHRICRDCRRVWKTYCVICRQNQRLNGKYHCKSCDQKYQTDGCQSHIWINDRIGYKRCWSIAPCGKKYCDRCDKFGVCSLPDCHKLASQKYCLDCRIARKEITNQIDTQTMKLVDKSLCIVCKSINRVHGELHCGRLSCILRCES